MTAAVDHRSRGMILLIVLWSLAIMAVGATALAALSRGSLKAERVEADRLRSEFALRAGLAVGEAAVLSVEKDQRLLFDGRCRDADLGQGVRASLCLRDAAGFVDLNRADLKLIEAVALASDLGAGRAAELSNAIGALRTKLQPPPDKAGGEKNAARSAANGQVPAARDGGNAQAAEAPPAPPPVFASLVQVRGLVDLPRPDMDRFLASAGLYSASGKLNPLAAPEEVLAAVPGMTPADSSAIMAARASGRGKQSPGLEQIVERYGPYLALEEPRAFLIGVTLTSGPGIIAGSRMSAVVLESPGTERPFKTLAWSW